MNRPSLPGELPQDILDLCHICHHLMVRKSFPSFLPTAFACNPGTHIHLKQGTLKMAMDRLFAGNQEGKLRLLTSMSGFLTLSPDLQGTQGKAETIAALLIMETKAVSFTDLSRKNDLKGYSVFALSITFLLYSFYSTKQPAAVAGLGRSCCLNWSF